MPRSLVSAKASLSVTGTVKNTMDIDSTKSASGQVTLTKSWDIADGVGVEQASRAWEWSGTLLAGSNFTVDLTSMVGLDAGAGSGRDIVGQTLSLLEIVLIAITNENDVDVDGTLEIYPDATNGWNPIGRHTVALGGALEAGGCLFKVQPSASGFALSGSSKNITLAAQYGDVDYKIVLLARHDDEDSSSSLSSSRSSSESSSFSSSSSSSLVSSASSLNSSSSSVSSASSLNSSSSSSSVSSSSSSSSS